VKNKWGKPEGKIGNKKKLLTTLHDKETTLSTNKRERKI
jgi:hypothetical protein